MIIPFVDLSALHAPLESVILRATKDLIAGGVLMGGKEVTRFETDFARYLGVAYCIACANGTDALEIILRALKIGQGDEVIVPANGWLSAAEATCLVGASPVYVDNHPTTYTIDPALIEDRITGRTRAIIPIHLYGRPAELPAIMAVAQRHGLFVIEDVAQAHGATYENRKAGSWGHAAIFSFYPTKNLGALGDGGAIVTNDAELAERVRSIAQHGQQVRNYPVRLGRNSRMDNLQAAILTLKLPYLDGWNQQRRAIAERYRRGLQNAEVVLPSPFLLGEAVHHLFVIQVDHRDHVRSRLQQKGVATAVHYPQTVIDMMQREASQSEILAPVAHAQAQRVLSLPIYPDLRDEQVNYVVAALNDSLISL